MAKSFKSSLGNTLTADNTADPMANLLGSTSDYAAPEETGVVSPRPIAVVADNAPEQSFGTGEELALTAADLLRRETELQANKKNTVSASRPPVISQSTTIEPEEPTYQEEEVTPERQTRRREVIAKFSAKFLDNIVTGASLAAHNYFVAMPDELVARQNDLMARLNSLSPTEQAELQTLHAKAQRYGDLEANFAEDAKMDEDDRAELQDCIQDITSTEDINIHPGWLILMIIGIKLISSTITIFSHRAMMRKR